MPKRVWKRKEVRQTLIKKSAFSKKKYLWKWKTIGDSLCPKSHHPRTSSGSSPQAGCRTRVKTPPWISTRYLSLCLTIFSSSSANGKHSLDLPESYPKSTLKPSWNKDVVFPVGKFWGRLSPFAYDLHILCTIWQEWRSINQSHPALKR